MSDLITYEDKIRLKSQNVSDKYKVTAEDMNEIKRVVNNNAEEVDEINKPENWVSVGATAPTDGTRVWFANSKNLLDEKTLRQGSGYDPTITNRVFFSSNYYLEPGTYTFYTNLNTINYKYAIGIASKAYPNPVSYVYDSGWQTLDHVTFTLSQSGYLGVGVAKSDGTSGITPSDISNYHFMLCKGSYDSTIPYSPYTELSINVDNEEWYSKPKVLWTNSSPDNNFVSQAVTLADNLSNYKYYEVIYRHHRTLNIYSSTGKVLSSEFALLMSSRFINATREVTAIGTGTITFGHSTDFLTYGSTTANNNNDKNIPIQILGYKE